MARKPEGQFVTSVNRYLPLAVHHEGMANPYRSGTPDEYYEGSRGVLWVEYKFLRTVPPNITPDLSPLQERWLLRAYNNGVNVAVIVGSPSGGVIYTDRSWEQTITRDEYLSRMVSRTELAAWIVKNVM